MRCQRTGKELDSTSDGSIMEGGVNRGDRNNIFVKTSDRAYAQSIH